MKKNGTSPMPQDPVANARAKLDTRRRDAAAPGSHALACLTATAETASKEAAEGTLPRPSITAALTHELHAIDIQMAAIVAQLHSLEQQQKDLQRRKGLLQACLDTYKEA